MGNTNELDTGAPIIKMTCVALSIANLLAMPTAASAADIMVGENGCTIVNAVIAAVNDTDIGGCIAGDDNNDTIVLPDNSIQSLSVGFNNGTIADPNPFTGLPFIETNVTIQGNGSTLRRDSSDPFRLIAVIDGNLTINDLTIENGSLSYNGGGIYVNADSELTLNRSTVASNTVVTGITDPSGYGGGLFTNGGQITLNDSIVSDNSAFQRGGGLYATDVSILNLNNSNVSNNSATRSGGGIGIDNGSYVALNESLVSGNSANYGGGLGIGGGYVDSIGFSYANINASTFSRNYSKNSGGAIATSASLTLSNSTLSENISSDVGGGLSASNTRPIRLFNSTLSGNSATTSGGAIYMSTSRNLYLYNSTLFQNSVSGNGSGIYARGLSTITLYNSIIGGSGDDVSLEVNSGLISDTASIIEEASFGGSRSGEPGLLPLANNGGPTKTHVLKANSIARNTGDLSQCTIEDQRGQTRDDGDGKCDVGAIEFNPNDDTSFIIIPLGNGKAAVIPN